MIKVDKGEITLEGNSLDLCTELTLAVRELVEAFEKNDMPKEIAIDLVKKAVELGFKDREELRKEAAEKIGKLFMRMFDTVFEDLEQEEQGE